MSNFFKKVLILLPLTMFIMACPMFMAEEEKEYTVSISITPADSGTVSPASKVVKDGDTISISATPLSGYRFVNWSGDYTGSTPSGTITVTRNMSITANFEAVTAPTVGTGDYTITTTTNDSNFGTTSVTGTQIEATPQPGYTFLRWEGDYTGSENPYDLGEIGKNMEITAVFASSSATFYTVNLAPSDTTMGRTNFTTLVAEAGSQLEISTTSNSGYRFTNWSGDASGSTNPLTVTVNSNLNITSNYERVDSQDWTILVHFAIDNDIDYSFEVEDGLMTNYINTLKSVKANDPNNRLKILMLMDGYNSVGNFQDGYYEITGSGTFADDLVVTKTEINSGDPKDVNQFIEWAVTNYPGDRYVYSVFNHGGGFNDNNSTATYGIGFDDSNNGDALSHKELAETTSYMKSLIGKKIDLFYTYACLMGGVELAYEVRDNADYILFSEELYPADEWSYEALNSLAVDSTISPMELGINFCNSALDYFQDYREFTLSLVDLSKMNGLYNSLNTYSTAAISEISSNPNAAIIINNIVEDTLRMNGNQVTDYYIDLGHYLAGVASNSSLSNTLKSSANSALNVYNDAVIYETKNVDWDENPAIENATGMTIYHTTWNVINQYSIETYKEILQFGSNNWSNYIQLMTDSTLDLPPDEYEPNNDFEGATIINYSDIIYANIHNEMDADIFKFYYDGNDPVNITVSETNSGKDLSNAAVYFFDSSYNYLHHFNSFASVDIDNTMLGSGNYYVIVAVPDNQPVALGSYKITYSSADLITPDIYEPDNTMAEATEIIVGNSPQEHNLSRGSDSDYFYIDMVEGNTYNIQTHESTALPKPDTYLHLYDESGNQLMANDDGGQGLFSKIVYDCTTSGRYYFKVRPYDYNNNRIGHYLVDVTETTAAPTLTIDYNPSKSK